MNIFKRGLNALSSAVKATLKPNKTQVDDLDRDQMFIRKYLTLLRLKLMSFMGYSSLVVDQKIIEDKKP